ncbi:MAG: hypothetical protein K2X44_03575, partial [Magnetospirillum sp.]|nr:hypothetical protein [Magnetospirillum sp.]
HELTRPMVIMVAGMGAAGCLMAMPPTRIRISGGMALALVLLLAAVFLGDMAEGMAPPADADSLAYHFVFAKHMAQTGGLVFEPRAVDGAIPQLLHVTYAMAMLLGGEQGLTLWCGLTGWLVVPLLLAAARPHVPLSWALAIAAVFVTLPAMLYGGGTGQAEPRTAAFALAATIAAALARRQDQGLRQALGWALLAGLFAGFYAGSKFPGLLLVATCGLALLCHRRGLGLAAVFSLAAAAMGFQWYFWNVLNSGDPVFPMLFHWGAVRDGLWNTAQDDYFRSMFSGTELAVAKSPLTALTYPFLATFWPMNAFDAGRIGFGVFPAIMLPFAVAGLWTCRRRLGGSPLTVIAAITLLTYLLWFLLGPSQRVRHLLPILPAFLLIMTVAVFRATQRWPWLLRPAVVAAAACLTLQLGGTALADAKAIRHVLTRESREDFLNRNVAGASTAAWISANVEDGAFIFTIERQLNFLLKQRHFYGNDMFQALVEIRPDNQDRQKYWRQLRERNFSHVLVRVILDGPLPAGGSIPLTMGLADDGCLSLVKGFPQTELQSRTLPGLGSKIRWLHLYRLHPESCPYEDKAAS